MKRRTFLRAAGGSAAGTLMLGLPKGWAGGAYADDSPETKDVRFGIIALTDCSPIVMAHELGYFKQFGIVPWLLNRNGQAITLEHHAHQSKSAA